MKKNTVARLICLLLALMMLTCLVIACAEPGEGEDTTPSGNNSDPSGSDTGDPTPVTDKYEADDIPDDLKYTGKTITLLYWSDREHEEFETEGQTGDKVNDALYERNLAIESRLGITMAFISTVGDSGNASNWVSYVNNSLQAGGGEFDVFGSYSLSTASCASKGYCYNLLDEECSYLNFDKPWWPDRLISEATINNKLYFASGDISANALYMMYVTFVNNDIIDDMDLPSIYDLIQSNEWTYEKFLSMCENIYIDLNADGEKNDGDRFGYMTHSYHADPWFYGSGALIVDKDANGNLQLSDSFYGEKVIKTLEMLTDAMYRTDDVIYGASKGRHQTEFNAGNLLFATDRCRISITKFDNEDLDFSIVPFPKYDSAQESFVTVMGNPFTLYAIPIDATEDELPMLSAYLEVYASESYRKVTPQLFDEALKYRYTNDPNAAEMYDLIRENLSFDLGRIFSKILIGQGNFRQAIADDAAGQWASQAKAIKKTMPNKLANLISAYGD